MSIETVYRVLKHNGELVGEYMDKKQADLHDQKLDGIYALAELIGEQARDLDSAEAEAIAEHLVDNKPARTLAGGLVLVNHTKSSPHRHPGCMSNRSY